tara:strand:+ start:434 stop:868 length:435 start_codon:yes stop_codon:yes gene_type:complete
VVRPKRLLDYVEKLDYIKSRRVQPYDLLRDFPQEKGAKGAEASRMLIEMAMVTVYTRSSSVSIEEEICFDGSWEGFYYNLWRCTRLIQTEDPKSGMSRVEKLFNDATPEERVALRVALDATEESHNLKNSDGPSEPQSSTPGNQ